MRCREVVAAWDDMRCGQEPRREDVLAHLRACVDCQAAYAEFEGVAYCLSCLPTVPPPQSLVPRIMAHIKEQCEQVRVRRMIELATVEAPIGTLHVGYRDSGIVFLFIDRGEGVQAAAEHVKRRLHVSAKLASGPPPHWVREALDAFFATGRTAGAPIDLTDVTEFERSVFELTAQVPPGEVRSYGWLANRLGKSNAARAVGQALANNPIPLLIPCHRIIDCRGRLNRYAYGVELKRRLLEIEGYLQEETAAGLRSS